MFKNKFLFNHILELLFDFDNIFTQFNILFLQGKNFLHQFLWIFMMNQRFMIICETLAFLQFILLFIFDCLTLFRLSGKELLIRSLFMSLFLAVVQCRKQLVDYFSLLIELVIDLANKIDSLALQQSALFSTSSHNITVKIEDIMFTIILIQCL